MDELQNMKNEIRGVKRSIDQILTVQGDMFNMVKNLKRSMDGKNFDLGKCCHTENINKILGAVYCTDGRYPVKNEEKTRLLKAEFNNSLTGLSVEELMLRCEKYENAKSSYWRSEERRQLLGIAGYEAISSASTDIMAKKILQFLGQKYVTSSETSLKNENSSVK